MKTFFFYTPFKKISSGKHPFMMSQRVLAVTQVSVWLLCNCFVTHQPSFCPLPNI